MSVVNPVLNHLGSRASLDMWMMESERFQYKCDGAEFTQQDVRRLTDLTQQAILDVVKDAETKAYIDQVIEITRGGGAT